MHDNASIEPPRHRGAVCPSQDWQAIREQRGRLIPIARNVVSRTGAADERDLNSIARAYVGDSAAAAEVRARLLAIAPSDASALILGESGTGKEVAAHILHEASPRRGKPFVAVDCGALSETLAESELFGHVRGAFTGATDARTGLFAQADGGTILLDEIASASLAIQARLMRVLESREVRTVGSNRTVGINVRVLAATNRDLRSEVQAGRFREDLLYRLDVIRVHLPRLRDRTTDIRLLAEHLLEQVSVRTGTGYRISSSAMHVLRAHDWPGNVRELRNALEHAAALCDDGVISAVDLPSRTVPSEREDAALTWEGFFAAQERQFLLARLEANGWNRSKTARELGMSRQWLHDRLSKHQLRPRASCMSPICHVETGR